MEVKITIETWNEEWRFEIENKEDDEPLKTGVLPTFDQCVSMCKAHLVESDSAERQEQPKSGSCFLCGGAEWTHSVRNHEFIPIRTTDLLLDEAKEWSKKQGYVTVSYIQRMMRIGYARASKLVDLMIEEGFCEKDCLDGHRRVLKTKQSTTERTEC